MFFMQDLDESHKKKVVQNRSYGKIHLFHYRMIQCREMFHFFNDLSTVFKYIRQFKLKITILLKNHIFS